MSKIVTLTLNPCVDKSSAVSQVMAERKLRCESPRYEPGGGGLNVARAVKKLGGEANALWTCGGVIGDLLRELLDEEGAAHDPIPVRGLTRENFIVQEAESGQQYRFGFPGARLEEQEQEGVRTRIAGLDPTPAYLVLSGSLPAGVPDDFYAKVARSAGGAARIVLDTSGAALTRGLEAPVFLLKPNLTELSDLAGRAVREDEAIREASRELVRDERAQVVVTSLGSAGAVLVSKDFEERISTPTVPISSKVGAGDSTVAGMVLALSRDEPLERAVRFGVAAGAAAVMTPGTGLCRREDTERLYQHLLEARSGNPT